MYSMWARVEGQGHTVQGLGVESTELVLNVTGRDVQYMSYLSLVVWSWTYENLHISDISKYVWK